MDGRGAANCIFLAPVRGALPPKVLRSVRLVRAIVMIPCGVVDWGGFMCSIGREGSVGGCLEEWVR